MWFRYLSKVAHDSTHFTQQDIRVNSITRKQLIAGGGKVEQHTKSPGSLQGSNQECFYSGEWISYSSLL